MRKRYGFGLAVIVVLGGAAAASPYVIGRMIGRVFAAPAVSLPTNQPVQSVLWQGHPFQAGYLRSTTTSTLVIGSGPGAITVPLIHVIHQGLGLDGHYARIETTLALQGEPAVMAARYFNGAPPLLVETTLFLDGHSNSHFNVPPVHGTLGGSALRLDFSGYAGDVQATGEQQIAYRSASQEITLDGPGGRIAIGGIGLDGSGALSGAGAATLGFKSMVVSSPGNETMQLSGVSTSTKASAVGDEAAFDVSYGFDRAQQGIAVVRHGVFALHLDHLDLPVLREALLRLRAITPPPSMQAAMARSPEDAQRNLMEMMGLGVETMNRLLKGSPVITLDPVGFEMDQGKLATHATLRIDGARIDPENPRARSNLKAIGLQAGIAIDDALLRTLLRLGAMMNGQMMPPGSIEPQIVALTQAGWVSRTGEQITSSLHLDGGHLAVNGKSADEYLVLLGAFMQ
jgi:uncharacterized protein YdgA (DUF945 family)